jgi:DNA-binding CsgD family transcriptional regulator/tetratricopeptide (TPR) repeat protein
MELIEREQPLTLIDTLFQKVQEEEGHCIFISGEAGIGKTSLVKAFVSKVKSRCSVYQGTCDALFTPRPLAPLMDVMFQMQKDLRGITTTIHDREFLFSLFFYQLKAIDQPVVLIFEDIHWADEATIDLIKFISRRITQLQCLFILTYREAEPHSKQALTSVFGQLSSTTFTRLQLLPLSRQAVNKMAEEKGYKGEDVFAITAGNPFYVTEILATYSTGVPENVKDSILSIYHRLDEDKKYIWQILSVLPTGFEVNYLKTMDPLYRGNIYHCLELQILVIDNGIISFKHELFRRIIESSLSPFLRIELNRWILELFRESFEKNQEIERIVHHAKAANANELVVSYAPLAAKHAASFGAHVQASKLYLTAIEYYQEDDVEKLVSLYQSYVYECYLSNQIAEAIIYSGKALHLLKKGFDKEKNASCLRLLSRLCWLQGSKTKAEAYGAEAINLMINEPSSIAKAMCLSNMSQLKMLSDEVEDAIYWGEKAIEMAEELSNDKIKCHALNNVGTALSRILSTRQQGNTMLQESLDIALANGFHEDVARAYTNLGSSAVIMKDYAYAQKVLQDGIDFGEEKDLNTWTMFLQSELARLHFEKGEWDKAQELTKTVLHNGNQGRLSRTEALVVLAKIKMRTATGDPLPLFLEAQSVALEMKELPTMIPALTGLLEYEWLTGMKVIDTNNLDLTISMVENKGNAYENGEFTFWLLKARNQRITPKSFFQGYNISSPSAVNISSSLWQSLGCPYEQAMALFEGTDGQKRQALEILDRLGATVSFQKLKYILRSSGMKKLPKGLRRTTRANTANLTVRELDVLQHMKKGLQNKEIGERLFISTKTVDHHISSILFKLNVNSRTKAVQRALETELIK